MIVDIIYSSWNACLEPDPMDEAARPFAADFIISNPVTYSHVHCAEALGIPLHLMFPQPWVPTKAFPHPLSRFPFGRSWKAENYLSYELVDRALWLSFERDLNNFRSSIGLEPLRLGQHGWNLLNYHQVPFIKMWSPSLVPRPKDWPECVDIVGAFFETMPQGALKPLPPRVDSCKKDANAASTQLKSGSSYDPKIRKTNSNDALMPVTYDDCEPSPELTAFLSKGGPVIFIGFGSMVVKDFEAIIAIFLEAAALAKVRVLIQLGWSSISPEKFMALALQAQTKANLVQKTIAFNNRDDLFFTNHSRPAPWTKSTSEAAVEEESSEASTSLSTEQLSSTGEVAPIKQAQEKKTTFGHWFVDVLSLAGRSRTTASSNKTCKSTKEEHLATIDESEPSRPGPSAPVSDISEWDELAVDDGWCASEDAFCMGKFPHHWLFQHVDAVVHHGGAGTTAAGLLHGLPTWICPFFGDQFFWGGVIHNNKLGPKPCPIDQLTLDIVVSALESLIKEPFISKAAEIKESMAKENGPENAVNAIYQHMPLENMLCEVSLFRGETRLAEVQKEFSFFIMRVDHCLMYFYRFTARNVS